jgi:hypothetical protein
MLEQIEFGIVEPIPEAVANASAPAAGLHDDILLTDPLGVPAAENLQDLPAVPQVFDLDGANPRDSNA